MQQQQQQAKADNTREREYCAAVGAAVLSRLGRPPAFNSIAVHRLYQDDGGWRLRANVTVVTEDERHSNMAIASEAIAHSFFVVADNEGEIVRSTPDIKRLY